MQSRLLDDCPILNSCLDREKPQPEKISKLLDTCNVKVGQIRDSNLFPDRIHVIFKRNQHLMFKYMLIFKHKFGLIKMYLLN